jgi:hypothetical protein
LFLDLGRIIAILNLKNRLILALSIFNISFFGLHVAKKERKIKRLKVMPKS